MSSNDRNINRFNISDYAFRDRYESAPIPMYYRIKEYLIQEMEAGHLKSGNKIPTEEQLSEQFQVSRMTARRAVDELVRKGKLIRRQGIGTFVSEPVIDQQLTKLKTIAEELELLGYSGLSSKILSWRVHKALTPLACILGIKTGKPVLRIKRVRYTKDIPLAVQTMYLPNQLVPDLNPSDLEKYSIYKIVEERFNKKIGWADQKIDAVKAFACYANLLGVAIGSPLLKSTRLAYLINGQPLAFSKTYFSSDRYSVRLKLYR